MDVERLPLAGAKLLKPKIHGDVRGFFLETYQRARYTECGIDVEFTQDNHSVSQVGCLRGLHFQLSPPQAKLVRVAVGKILDVLVDVRATSPTFGHHLKVPLCGQLHHQLFVPAGFAHGFVVTEGPAHVIYKVSSPYDPRAEQALAYDDPDVGIAWPTRNPLVSARDASAPSLKSLGLGGRR